MNRPMSLRPHPLRVAFNSLRRLMWPALLLQAFWLLQASPPPANAGGDRVVVARLENDPIITATETYLTTRLDLAEEEGVPFVLVLDTPGGAVDTTRAIVQRFLGSKVPVLVLVGPSGARAGSAGVFITLASHVAGMTPGTNIGAAHPIGAGVGAPRQGGDDSEQARSARSEEEVMAQKIENDLVAFAESIATTRGRNVEWAIDAVRNSASVPAERALELGVIDMIVPDLDAFLVAVDGREVVIGATTHTLNTAGAEQVERPRSLRERVQIALGNPSLAYMLMSLGVMGIVLELYHPGMMLGGVVGGICLVLALASGLPFSAAGLLLLAAAAVLFVLEVYVTSFGLLALAGGVCMVLGGIFLFEAPPDMPTGGDYVLSVGLPYLVSVGVVAVAFALIMAYLIAKAQMRRPAGGEESLIGEEGRASVDFVAGKGKVFFHGEYWNAECEAPIRTGDAVRVVGVQGLKVKVEAVRAPQGAGHTPSMES